MSHRFLPFSSLCLQNYVHIVYCVLCVYIDNNVVIATFNAYTTIQNENKYPEKDQIKITKLHTEYKINERERKAHTRNLWREKKRKKDERNDLWSTFQK